ncbi:uncharacterized protein LOC143159361 isoform X1 [Aptenodytes patagonicus]|uniref:uncharacterized protein LOC143159361 isoform X1 n=1 Tax=Aptenodytes patagonicus TaxID=9234 RepID=UPI003F9F39B9
MLPDRKWKACVVVAPRIWTHQGSGEMPRKGNFDITYQSEEQIEARYHFTETRRCVYQSRFWQQGRQAAEVTPCRPQTVPAVSAKDPLQDTAQPSSQVGGTFVKRPDNQRNERKKVRNSSMNTKVREEGGGEGAPGTRADTPLQPVEKTTLEQISTPRPGEEPTPERLGIS